VPLRSAPRPADAADGPGAEHNVLGFARHNRSLGKQGGERSQQEMVPGCPKNAAQCAAGRHSLPAALAHNSATQTWPTETGLRNVDANYPFERSHRFAGIQPNSGFGDYSRLSCGVGDTQLGRRPGSRQGCLRGRHQPSSRGFLGSEPNSGHGDHAAFELQRRKYAARDWVLPGSSPSILHGRWPSPRRHELAAISYFDQKMIGRHETFLNELRRSRQASVLTLMPGADLRFPSGETSRSRHTTLFARRASAGQRRAHCRDCRPLADIPVADRDQARAEAFILQPRFLRARYYLPFPDLRDSDASTLRTSDCEIPNCLAMREGVIPALKVARTAFTWPCVNATSGSSGCRRSDDSSVAIDGSDARSPAPIWVAGRISGALAGSLPRRCSSCRVAAISLSRSRSSNCWSALERSLGSTCRGDDLSAVLTTAADCWADVWCAGVRQGS
jgi:hypothetical protein